MGAEGGVEPNTIESLMALEDGDAFLLCSDGWWDHFDKRAIEAAFAASRTPDEWLGLMADAIRLAAAPRQDNYSAIAVWIGDPAETTRLSSLWGETVPGPFTG